MTTDGIPLSGSCDVLHADWQLVDGLDEARSYAREADDLLEGARAAASNLPRPSAAFH